jgi:DNA mismatch repair protein MutL
MFPVTKELNPSDLFILKEIKEELDLLGFKITTSGKNKIIINGKPSGVNSSDPVEMLEIMIEDYKNTKADPLTGAKERVAASMAAASAIPYGKALSQNEMEDLFDTLFACQSPNYSPKGRAVISILTLDEIDKKFK